MGNSHGKVTVAPPSPTSTTAPPGQRPPARHRGRPYRLPVDTTPIAAGTPGLQDRAAWLLGVSRIHSSDPKLLARTTFLDVLADLGVQADMTKLSRWESGRTAVPDTVVRAYEQALGLPAGHLSVGISLFAKNKPSRSRRVDLDTDATEAHQQLDTLFSEVLDGAAPGQSWLALCTLLTHHRQLYLLPHTWGEVAMLLAEELVRSTGLEYLTRLESLRMLVGYPSSRRQSVKAIGAVVTNPAIHFVIQPLALLQEVEDGEAFDLLCRLLRAPVGHVRAGAAWAVSEAVRRGFVTDDKLRHLEGVVADLVRQSGGPLHRWDSLNLYPSLPPASRERVDRLVADPGVSAMLQVAATTGELVRPDQARSIATRIAAHVQERTSPEHALEPDQMLHRLVREALFHVRHQRRHQAAMLLAVSPYRHELAAPLLDLAEQDDEMIAILGLSALFQIARPADRGRLWQLAFDDKRRASVRMTAFMVLSQVVGTVDDAEGAALRRLVEAGTMPFARGALHVLGMAGGPHLASVEAVTQQQAGAVAWWRKHPAIPRRD